MLESVHYYRPDELEIQIMPLLAQMEQIRQEHALQVLLGAKSFLEPLLDVVEHNVGP